MKSLSQTPGTRSFGPLSFIGSACNRSVADGSEVGTGSEATGTGAMSGPEAVTSSSDRASEIPDGAAGLSIAGAAGTDSNFVAGTSPDTIGPVEVSGKPSVTSAGSTLGTTIFSLEASTGVTILANINSVVGLGLEGHGTPGLLVVHGRVADGPAPSPGSVGLKAGAARPVFPGSVGTGHSTPSREGDAINVPASTEVSGSSHQTPKAKAGAAFNGAADEADERIGRFSTAGSRRARIGCFATGEASAKAGMGFGAEAVVRPATCSSPDAPSA